MHDGRAAGHQSTDYTPQALDAISRVHARKAHLPLVHYSSGSLMVERPKTRSGEQSYRSCCPLVLVLDLGHHQVVALGHVLLLVQGVLVFLRLRRVQRRHVRCTRCPLRRVPTRVGLKGHELTHKRHPADLQEAACVPVHGPRAKGGGQRVEVGLGQVHAVERFVEYGEELAPATQ